jgi:hypothetical protein
VSNAAPRSRILTIHVVASCDNCGWMTDDYKKGVDLARRHAEQTGHMVAVERCQTFYYNKRKK